MGVALRVAPVSKDEPPADYGAKRGTSRKRPPVPRVPIIGVDTGAIPGSKPGGELGAAAYLERCGRDIVRGKLRRTRRRDHKGA